MEEIKSFIEKFLEIEAKVSTLKRIPELEYYNNTLQEYFNFLVSQLQGAMGHMPLEELRSPAEYEMLDGYPDDKPRLLFKISEYLDSKYGSIWIVYMSGTNPGGTYKRLDNAFVIIEEEGNLKIAKHFLYTNYTPDRNPNEPYRWDNMGGYPDLNLENLEKPLRVERLIEPSDWAQGLVLYNQEK